MKDNWDLAMDLVESKRRLSSKEKLGTRFPVIGMIGPLGAGKSTLAELLEVNLNVPAFPVKRFKEEYPENPYLPLMFDGKAYESEVIFLRSKMRQLGEARTLSAGSCVIVDPAAEGDALFAHAIYEMGWMSKYKLGKYMGEYGQLSKKHKVPVPDFYVVVNAPPDVLRARIEQRITEEPEREFERRILTHHPEYIDVLSATVDRFAQTVRATKPVIFVDSQKSDFVDTPGGRWNVVADVVNWMGYYADRPNFKGSTFDKANLVMPNIGK